MTPARRKTVTRVVGAAAGLILAAMLGGAVIGYLSAADPAFDADAANLWLIGGIATMLMVGSLAVSVIWMRAIDEAAREAHKAAWFWGGCSGMAAGGVLGILATLPGAERWTFPTILDGRTDPAAYAATGAFGILTLMIIGYTVVWAWWWLTRR